MPKVDKLALVAPLSKLGLEVDPLLEVVKRGHHAWASCTGNHPPLFPGLYAWAETVCALREYLLPIGWHKSDDGNLPVTISPDSKLAITVATGDISTGDAGSIPSTKGKKGPRTAQAVTINQYQLNLFPPQALPFPIEMMKDRTTWVLLIHRDIYKNEIRCELSRPINIGVDGRVDNWAERIILGAIPFDDEIFTSDTTPPPPINIEVIKRVT